jgi:hypothetical protein
MFGLGRVYRMFSYVDLVRGEIALELEERFEITIPDEETDGWLTLGDVARSVVGRVGGTVTETEVFSWVRTLMVEGYGATELAEVTPDGDVFSDYERATTWFLASYPHHLADRSFAGNQNSAESRFGYYCAYYAPSDLTALPPAWRTDKVVSLARGISASLDFSSLSALADALQDAGCDNEIMLDHCRNPHATHIRGCWVIDLVLGEGRYRAKTYRGRRW